jgi:putative ABC transport system permease protein
MLTLVQDFRFAIRTLKRGWLVTVVAIVSLAVAIGGNAAVFSLVDALLFRPLPYPDPERIVLVGEREKDQPELSGFTTSLPTYADMAERSGTVAEWAAMQPRTLSLRGSERAEAVPGVAVTSNFFELLGAGAVRGRTFSPAEAGEGAPRVVVLSHEYLQRTFGEDDDPLGQVLTLNGEPHEVIGVLPPGFHFLSPNQDLWVPLTRSPRSAVRDQRNLLAVGRMKADATMAQIRAELTNVAEQLEAEYPEAQRGWTVDTYNLRYDVPSRQTRLLFVLLQGSVVLVLIIACVNITNLLLARGQDRTREIALRTVLGAGRARVIRQLLTESSVLVLMGALLGLGAAALGIRAMGSQLTDVLPASWAVALDSRVLLFTLGISVLAGLVFGLAPALQTLRQSHVEALKEGRGRSGRGPRRRRMSRALVVSEIALSFVALGGGSLLVRSFLQIRASDPGFETGNLLTAVVAVPASKYPDDEARVLLKDEVLERVRTLSGVRSVAFASTLPQTPIAPTDTFRVEGIPVDGSAAAPQAIIVQASADYLRTMEIGLVRGRFFAETDRLGDAPVAVINRSMAEARFGARSPLGERLVVREESREIIGVVEDVQQVLLRTGGAASGETVYLPVGQAPEGVNVLVLRTAADPREVAEPLRTALQGLDQDLTVSQVQTMEEFVAQFFVGIQVFNVVLGGFGLVALLLASLGTYGVLAYSVSQRSHEIGIRMAVGAEQRQVARMIARQGFWLGVIGLGIGTGMTLPLVGVMQSILEGVSTVQPAILLIIGAVLLAVTMTASFMPAARAASMDPVRTLRDE